MADAGGHTNKRGGKKKKKEVSPDEMADMIQTKISQLAKDTDAPLDTSEVIVPEGTSAELREKYISEVQKSRLLEREVTVLKRKFDNLAKEKDTLALEIQRSAAYKAKLEDLCRELRKQNKAIMDDVRAKGEEEQQKRKELSERFNATIGEITTKMEDQHAERLKIAQENDILRAKVDNLRESIQLREEAYTQQLKTKELEVKMAQARQMQAEQRTAEEELKLAACQRRLEQQGKHEEELRSQLSTYSSKFETFQETLTKSNAVFQNFKAEMDKMAKKVKLLEHENGAVKKKLAKAEQQIVELTDERAKNRKKLTQIESLEKLCQALQKDRQQLRAQLEGRSATAGAESSPAEGAPADPAAETQNQDFEQQFAQQLEQIPEQLSQQLKYVVDPQARV